ncbi:MAG: hypothetical protein GC191_09230 [Azospirillum sp.]|nr:hypothetical protein [Azospirillum sp.]
MAVSVNISADASSVQNSLDRVRDAVKRVNQEARALHDIDLGHPELQGVTDDIEKLQRGFENLKRVRNSATAEAIRRGGYSDVLDWDARHGEQFPEPGRREAHERIVRNYIANPANQGQGQAGGADPGRLSSVFDRFSQKFEEWNRSFAANHPNAAAVGGGLIRGGAFAAGLAGIPMIGGMLAQAVRNAQDDLISTDALGRTIRDTGAGFDQLNAMVHKAAEGLGLTHNEAQHLASTWAKLGNETNAQSISDHMRLSAGLARGYGVDPGMMAATMARAQFAGMDPKQFAALLGQTIESSGMTGRADEVMQTIAHWTETSSRALVTGNTSAEFASWYAALNASGNVGFRGAAAADILGSVNSTLSRGGGGGEASQILSFQAMSRHGVSNIYEQQYLREGGMFTALPDGSNLFQATQAELRDRFGITDETDRNSQQYRQYLANLSAHLGVNMHQAEGLDTLPPLTPDANGLLARSGLDWSGVNPTGMRDIYAILESRDPSSWRSRMVGRRDISDADKSSLSELSGDDLKIAMMRLAGKYGMEGSEGSRTQQASANMENDIAKLGGLIVPLTNTIKELVDKLVRLVDNGGSIISGSGMLSLLSYGGSGSGAALLQNASYSVPALAAPAGGERRAGGAPVDLSRGIPSAIVAAARSAGVDPGLALTTASIESNMGRAPDTPGSQYRGAFQLGNQEWRDSGGGDRNDLALQIHHGVTNLAVVRRDLARRLGREPAPWEVYLAAQQGVAGAAALLSADPEAVAADVIGRYYRSHRTAERAITGNTPGRYHPSATMSAGRFREMWRDIYGERSRRFGAALPADDPRRAATGGAGQNMTGQLHVYHRNQDGTQLLGTEMVPLNPGPPEPVGGSSLPNFELGA